MNTNIVFKFSKDTIVISEIKKEVDYKSLNNTNIIDTKDLKFSTEYIKENMELVSNFLNVTIIKKNITTVQINNMNFALLVMDLVNTWEHINKLIIKPDKNINLDLFLKILDNPYINYVDCYSIQKYLLERIDVNRNIKIHTRTKLQKQTSFTEENLIETMSDIYYKKIIAISTPFNEDELEEFRSFIEFNNKLKYIKIVNYSNETLTSILEELKIHDKEHITIEIYERNNDINVIYNTITYLKKKYRKYIEENDIKFKINYSNKYKKDNFFKEINYKLLTSIILVVIAASFISIGINCYVQYVDGNKINDQMNEFEEIINDAQTELNIDDNESDIDIIDIDDTTKKKTNIYSAYYTNYEQVFEKLKTKNGDTVGWLQVNNTKINHPVVQAKTNSYYLNRDFNKWHNTMGWIFMDYRNNPVNLSRNTIIYGHNIKAGLMFGTIKNIYKESWYTKTSNQYITFNTPTRNMKWRIFSIYRIDTTDDYLKINFKNNDDYMNFVNALKSRSIYDFGFDIDPNSKILTLSTCNTNTTRSVVHAVLVEDNDSSVPQIENPPIETTTTTTTTTTVANPE